MDHVDEQRGVGGVEGTKTFQVGRGRQTRAAFRGIDPEGAQYVCPGAYTVAQQPELVGILGQVNRGAKSGRSGSGEDPPQQSGTDRVRRVGRGHSRDARRSFGFGDGRALGRRVRDRVAGAGFARAHQLVKKDSSEAETAERLPTRNAVADIRHGTRSESPRGGRRREGRVEHGLGIKIGQSPCEAARPVDEPVAARHLAPQRRQLEMTVRVHERGEQSAVRTFLGQSGMGPPQVGAGPHGDDAGVTSRAGPAPRVLGALGRGTIVAAFPKGIIVQDDRTFANRRDGNRKDPARADQPHDAPTTLPAPWARARNACCAVVVRTRLLERIARCRGRPA